MTHSTMRSIQESSFIRFASLLVIGMLFASAARAEVSMQWMTVGDTGNVGDTQVMTVDGTSGYGAVPYSYRIGKHEVTNAQYVEFLNAKDATGANTLGLYSSGPAWAGGIDFTSSNANGAKYTVRSG